MFSNSKLHYYSITAALASAGGLILVFLASGFVFASSNPFSKSAMLVGGLLMLIGIVEPRRMLVMLVPITFYLDGVKRLLIIFGKTDLADVTTILAVAPLATAGIIIGCIIQKIFLKKAPLPAERFAIFGALGAFVALGGTEIFTTGDLLNGLKTAANTTVYFLLPWVVLQCFRTREQIDRFLRFSLLVGLPVALYGSWQYVMGLSQFEIEYLKSGLTTVGEINLEDIRPRPFSTFSSPHPYACVMSFMVVLSAYYAYTWTGQRRNWKRIWIFFIYALGLLFSLSRGATLTTLGMLIFAKLFRSRSGVLKAYLISFAIIGSLIFFAKPLLESLDALQRYMPGGSDWKEQAFRLGTLSNRLIGYENVLGNPSNWPLIANPLKFDSSRFDSADSTLHSHDLFSQMILRIGAIPVFFGLCMGVFFIRRAHRAVLLLPAGKGGSREIAAVLMAMLVVFLLGQTGGGGMTVFPINFWLGMFTGLLTIICLRAGTSKAVTAHTGEELLRGPALAAPAGAGPR